MNDPVIVKPHTPFVMPNNVRSGNLCTSIWQAISSIHVQAPIQDFGRGGPGEFWPQGPWALNLLKIGFFPLKLPENCMNLKKSWGKGGGPPGPSLDSLLLFTFSLFCFSVFASNLDSMDQLVSCQKHVFFRVQWKSWKTQNFYKVCWLSICSRKCNRRVRMVLCIWIEMFTPWWRERLPHTLPLTHTLVH